MFKTGLTKGIFESFLRSHSLNRSEIQSSPFIFVDPATGQVKLLTNLLSTTENMSEIFAFSVANGGDVEILSTES